MDKKAESIRIGSDRLIYLPYLMGERTPHKDPDCRGVFFGLSAIHTKAHLIRAVMEGISFSLLDCLNIIRSMGMGISDMMVCGGGSKSPLWRRMLSSIFDCHVTTIKSSEGAVLGAAILSAVGTGIFPNVPEACDRIIVRDKVYKPNSDDHREYMKYYKVYHDIYPLLKNEFKELGKLN
jgi:xylulokinase